MIAGVIAEELLLPQIVQPYDGAIDYAYYAILDPSYINPDTGEIGGIPPDKQDWTSWWDPFTIFPPANVRIDGYIIIQDQYPNAHEQDNVNIEHFITVNYQPIIPLLVNQDVRDDDVIYSDFISTIIPAINPRLLIDQDLFFGSIVKSRILAPRSLFIDPDGVYVPVCTLTTPFLSPSSFIETDVLYRPIFGPLVPGIVTEADIIYAATRINRFLAGGVVESDVLFVPFVAREVASILVVDHDVFNGPAITRPGAMDYFIDPGEFVSSPTVTPQSTGMSPGLVDDSVTDAFYSPGGGQGIAGADFPDDGTLYAPAASRAALQPVVSVIDPDMLFAPAVVRQTNQTLVPSLHVEADVIPVLLIILGLAPGLYADTDTIPVPTGAGASTLTSGLFNDADMVYVPTIAAPAVTIAPSLFNESDVFTPTGTGGGQVLTTSLCTDSDAFYVPTVKAFGFDGTLALDGPIMPMTPQPTVIYIEG